MLDRNKTGYNKQQMATADMGPNCVADTQARKQSTCSCTWNWGVMESLWTQKDQPG